MSRLTANKPVDEMSMLELAYNSCYAKDGKAMYEDYETVRDARDFARNLYKAYLDEELPTDDEEFDGRMMDDLQFESEVHLRGLIALFYRNLWVMADLREKLKAYEDKEEQGMLIELPVSIGGTVYEIIDKFDFNKNEKSKDISTSTVIHINGNEKNPIILVCGTNSGIKKHFTPSAFGIRAFTTRSEAEEALAKMGGRNESQVVG